MSSQFKELKTYIYISYYSFSVLNFYGERVMSNTNVVIMTNTNVVTGPYRLVPKLYPVNTFLIDGLAISMAIR